MHNNWPSSELGNLPLHKLYRNCECRLVLVLGGPSGWRSCCTRRTTPPATGAEGSCCTRRTTFPARHKTPRSIWADHLGGVRVAIGAPRPRQQTRRVTRDRHSYPHQFDDDADPDVLHPSTQLPVPVDRRTTTPIQTCCTDRLNYPCKFERRRGRATPRTSGGPDLLHNTANSLGVAGAFRRRTSSQ